ncbi:RNA methyltransferase [Pendulispora albinea]|uniref:RNA methyltransferase n=1 Tax=Pendulispora albinea TaxID=2741071 RepID=A0ABZ2LQN1_9BACT
MRTLAIALVHYPVLDKAGDTVTTAITNLDVHDLARSARTYGCSDYFIVHPIAAQRDLVERICDHWTNGSSGKRIPDRKVALELVRVVPSLEDMYARFGGRQAVEVWITAARRVAPPISMAEASRRLEDDRDPRPVIVLFGTGWGLASSVVESADATIESIRGRIDTSYNHLSVRAACAITLDRLRGAR